MPALSRLAVRASVSSLAIPLFAALIVGFGCGDDKSGNGGASGPRFDPAEITIVVGDTIRFVATSGDHTVTSGTGAQDPNSGQLFNADLPEGDEFRHVFSTPGTFDYYCIPHEADGMVGTVTVEDVEPKTVDVFVSGVTFNPEVVTINPGDQVRWTVNGSHTITSGTGPTDPNAGDRFDETVNTGSVITVTFNDLGTIPYFCQLHFAMGMTGTINVVPRPTKTVEVEALN